LAHYVIRYARNAGIAALFVTAAGLGVLTGVVFAYAGDLPQISALDNYAPSTITRVYGAGGQGIGDFAVERRLVVGYDEIAPDLRMAIIAAEDGDFNSHFGLSISRIAVTLARDVFEFVTDRIRGRTSRPAGASTLTQQLARIVLPEAVGFYEGEISLERKIREAIVAIQIEKRYTKREILTMFANQMYWGHNAYGVESAARLYFAKSAKDVTLEEAAMLAGIIQGNVRQSPYVNMEAAVRRRNYTLGRMADEGFIDPARAEEAKAKPIIVRGEPRQPPSIAPYFLEEVRKHLETRYGAKRLYEGGLSVKTTLDPALQDAANRAVAAGLRRIDKRRGYRRATRNVLAEKQTVQGFAHERWTRTMAAGDVVPAVVAAVGRPPAAAGIKVRIGRYQADLTRESFADWPRPPSPASFNVGDLIDVGLMSLNEGTKQATVTLEQTPLVEGALVALDNRTGQIRAMVGGWSFSRSKFNRAVQAYRQLGSTFKPIVYTAAIDRGLTPATIIVDQPISYPAGSGGLYEPQNYDHKFEGPVTLRRALEQSRNIPAIKMMEEVGPANVVSYARRFGFAREFPPYLPIALGAGEGTLLEVTSAYTVFPNRGVRAKPYFIQTVTDRGGNLLEEGRIESVNVIRADTAFMITSLLEGVVRRGTGEAASSIEWPLAGKTGTVDDNTDAWFIGFDPDITVGVWTGHDAKKTMGANETGAVAALPIWMDFMKAYVANRTDPPAFVAPENIVFLPVDRATGTVVPGQTPGAITETFIAGTQPGGIDVER
jgi:penicillin-binding protein 1A